MSDSHPSRHILLVHQAFTALDEPGGTRHHELALYLANQGWRVTIIASPVSYLTGRVGKYQALANPSGRVQIIRAYTYSALHRSFVHRVISFLSFMFSSFWAGLWVRDVDLVWGTSPPIFQGITAWILALLKRTPFLFEVRDLWPAFAVQVGVLRNRLLIRVSEWLERFLYRRADEVVVNSPGFIPHVTERGAKKLSLIPNGADIKMFNPLDDGAAFRRQYGLEGKVIILYAGAHGFSNDLGIVLEAAQLLRDQSEVMLVLLGDGKEKPALQRQAVEMGLENVMFLPPVPKMEMAQALAAADAGLGILKPIPLYGTVYPNKIFDYMAAGRPVILAMHGVIQEVVEEAGCGLVVTPGDAAALAGAIRQLAQDAERRVDMGRRGRIYLEAHFDREMLAEKFMMLADRLIRTGKRYGG